MKRIVLFCLVACLLLYAFASCTQPSEGENNSASITTTTTTAGTPQRGDDTPLRILGIGNSYTEDMMEYTWQIATALGYTDVKIAYLFIGGTNLATHNNHAQTNAAVWDFRVNENGTWVSHKDHTMDDALRSDDWDFITMQQQSAQSGIPSTFEPHLSGLVEHVRGIVPTAKLVWHMTWAYPQSSTDQKFTAFQKDQMTMYNAIVQTTQSVIVPSGYFDRIIPSGTAIQNARTSYLGDTMHRDSIHLSIPLGRYIAGLTMIHTLTGLPLDGVSYAPDGVNEVQKEIAVDAAQKALATPFAVTQSIYP